MEQSVVQEPKPRKSILKNSPNRTQPEYIKPTYPESVVVVSKIIQEATKEVLLENGCPEIPSEQAKEFCLEKCCSQITKEVIGNVPKTPEIRTVRLDDLCNVKESMENNSEMLLERLSEKCSVDMVEEHISNRTESPNMKLVDNRIGINQVPPEQGVGSGQGRRSPKSLTMPPRQNFINMLPEQTPCSNTSSKTQPEPTSSVKPTFKKPPEQMPCGNIMYKVPEQTTCGKASPKIPHEQTPSGKHGFKVLPDQTSCGKTGYNMPPEQRIGKISSPFGEKIIPEQKESNMLSEPLCSSSSSSYSSPIGSPTPITCNADHCCGSLFGRCAQQHGKFELLQTFTDPTSSLSQQTFNRALPSFYR